MYSTVIIVENMAIYTWKLLRLDVKHSNHSYTHKINYVR